MAPNGARAFGLLGLLAILPLIVVTLSLAGCADRPAIEARPGDALLPGTLPGRTRR